MMKSTSVVKTALLAGLPVAIAREIANPAKQWKYESGLVHETIMDAKHVRQLLFRRSEQRKADSITGCMGRQEASWGF